jgi:hypothetical protein
MPQTRTSCPRCRQPVIGEINQLFDVNVDPEAKKRFMSGQFNQIHCSNCGYEGQVASPIVYHDPAKELLLTYFPPELGLPLNEQERLIGPLINQVTKNLPPEKRKAYLFRPQAVLTMQGLVERVLEGEGITREMIQAQQQRLSLLQRLLSASSDAARDEIIKQDQALIDESFFALSNQLIEASIANEDEQSARALADLQKKLLETTAVGNKLQSQAKETEAAIKSLQEASKKGLTREKLLDMMVEAPTETRLATLVSLARNGLDYTFFELLTKRIEIATGENQQSLIQLREKLLKLTQEIDAELKKRADSELQKLEALLKEKDLKAATTKLLPELNDFFLDALNSELETARNKGNLERSAKLQEIMGIIQEASAPPPEIELIQELLDSPDDKAMQAVLQAHQAEINSEFLQVFSSVLNQPENDGQDPKVIEKLQKAYRAALRFSMEANLK